MLSHGPTTGCYKLFIKTQGTLRAFLEKQAYLKRHSKKSNAVLGVFESADKALEASQSIRQHYRTDSAELHIIKQEANQLHIPFWMNER